MSNAMRLWEANKGALPVPVIYYSDGLKTELTLANSLHPNLTRKLHKISIL